MRSTEEWREKGKTHLKWKRIDNEGGKYLQRYYTYRCIIHSPPGYATRTVEKVYTSIHWWYIYFFNFLNFEFGWPDRLIAKYLFVLSNCWHCWTIRIWMIGNIVGGRRKFGVELDSFGWSLSISTSLFRRARDFISTCMKKTHLTLMPSFSRIERFFQVINHSLKWSNLYSYAILNVTRRDAEQSTLQLCKLSHSAVQLPLFSYSYHRCDALGPTS